MSICLVTQLSLRYASASETVRKVYVSCCSLMLSDLCRGSWSGLHLQHAEHNTNPQCHCRCSFHEKVKATWVPPRAEGAASWDRALCSAQHCSPSVLTPLQAPGWNAAVLEKVDLWVGDLGCCAAAGLGSASGAGWKGKLRSGRLLV